jgi:Glu-tRNA(Gln) amidotransferase subunit E-like FAD-binding protein
VYIRNTDARTSDCKMRLRDPNGSAVCVTDPKLKCIAFETIIHRLHNTADKIVAEGKLQYEYDGFHGVLEKKTVVLNPETDIPLLFVALKIYGQIVARIENGVTTTVPEEKQKAMGRVYKMVRDEAKSYLNDEVYQNLQALCKQARKEDNELLDVYPRLFMLLGHN